MPIYKITYKSSLSGYCEYITNEEQNFKNMAEAVFFLYKAANRKLAKITDIKVYALDPVQIFDMQGNIINSFTYPCSAFQRFCDFCTLEMAMYGYENKWACAKCKRQLF